MTRRRLAQNEAEHNAQFLRLVADSVSVLIAYVDLERRYQFINRRYAEAFGFSAEAAVVLLNFVTVSAPTSSNGGGER